MTWFLVLAMNKDRSSTSGSAAHRFLAPEWRAQDRTEIVLSAAEQRHMEVLRIAENEEIELFDGSGDSCQAVFREQRIQHLADFPRNHREPHVALSLVVAALKRDRLEWMIEKATEIGVCRIAIFDAERSVAKPSHRKQERWRQIATSAAKQCGRTVVPEICSSGDFSSYAKEHYDHKAAPPQRRFGSATGQGAESKCPIRAARDRPRRRFQRARSQVRHRQRRRSRRPWRSHLAGGNSGAGRSGPGPMWRVIGDW